MEINFTASKIIQAIAKPAPKNNIKEKTPQKENGVHKLQYALCGLATLGVAAIALATHLKGKNQTETFNFLSADLGTKLTGMADNQKAVESVAQNQAEKILETINLNQGKIETTFIPTPLKAHQGKIETQQKLKRALRIIQK